MEEIKSVAKEIIRESLEELKKENADNRGMERQTKAASTAILTALEILKSESQLNRTQNYVINIDVHLPSHRDES